MTLQLTLGRTTFLVRREPAKPATSQQATPQQSTTSFAAAWMQTFNGTWEAKGAAGRLPPVQQADPDGTGDLDD